ncbi:MAG: hypothetical protein KAU50_12010 [Candidatus Marinimicrobia bacterium]|nr:hypothetical protein [Candidatus Neomarinimicrobiota bacterium]
MTGSGFEREYYADSEDQQEITPDEEVKPGSVLKEEPTDVLKWEEKALPSFASLAIAHKTVVKKSKVLEARPTRITPAETPLAASEEMKVSPIIENEIVVGLNIACECGNRHEIRFEYDL